MKPKDLTESFYDKMINILYSYIKDCIDWKKISDIAPRKIHWYTGKKRCQLLLAITDTKSPYTAKYIGDDISVAQAMSHSIYCTQSYIDNFRPTRSLMYMKAFRKSYMVDIFGMCTCNYDNILKHADYSHDKALAVVKSSGADMLIQTANQLKAECRTNQLNPTAENFETVIEQNELIIDMCNELTQVTNLFSLNCKRVTSNVLFTMFDIQSLYNIAFDPAFSALQRSDIDGFEIARRQKIAGEIISAIVDAIHSNVVSTYKVETEYDKEYQCAMKVHRLAIPIEEDESTLYEVRISHADPLIIST